MRAALRAREAIGHVVAAHPIAGPPGELTVFNAHRTPVAHAEQFKKGVARVGQHYEWLPASDVPKYFSHQAQVSRTRPLAVLSFDDGFRDNMWSAEFLAAEGISAIYFIATGFVTAPDPWEFLTTRIRQRSVAMRPGESPEDFVPMTPDDVARLVELGHVVGSHTVNHRWLQNLDDKDVDHELAGSLES